MSETAEVVRAGSRLGTVLGIVTIIAGMLAISAPLYAGLAATTVVGVLVLAGGIARTFYAFKAESLGQGLFIFLFGGLAIVCGLVILGHPLLGLASLTLFLAAYFLVEGIAEIMTGFKLKGEQGWAWLVVGGVASLVLGFLIWQQWPVSGAWAIGVLLGIRLIMAGWTMIALGAIGRGAAEELEAT